MSDNRMSSMSEKTRRRRRVERLKLTIWMGLVLWVLISITTFIVMAIGMHSLNNKIKVLEENQITLQNYINENLNKTTETDDSDTEETTSEGEEEKADESAEATDEEVESAGEVYLTFDDGPSDNTEEILDILDEYGVKATFFVCGKEDETSLALYKEIVDRGHTLGMHSYSHNYSTLYKSLKSFKSDFNKIHSLLEDVTGLDITLYRFPGGSSNQVSNIDMKECISWFNEKGIVYYDWNVSSEDAVSNSYTAKSVIKSVMRDIGKYTESVVLLHDTAAKDETVKALPDLIEKLQKQGYELLPITEDTTPVQHISADSVS